MTNDQVRQTSDQAVANATGVVLGEICRDDEDAMTCAACMRVASFPDRASFVASDWSPSFPGPLIATELATFDIWMDDPQFAVAPVLTPISQWVPARSDRPAESTSD